MSNAQQQLEGFFDKYTPEIAAKALWILKKLRKRYPTATVWVYDNYNALAIGFGPPSKPSSAIFSIVLYPRWVSLFFLQAKGVPDPQGLLKGKGSTARHIVLASVADLDRPELETLFAEALARAKTPLSLGGKGEMIIQSISVKQRPRRPTG